MTTTDEELERVLATRMLDCLDSAIDEAQDSRQQMKSGAVSDLARPQSFYAERLQLLDLEIENLETLQQKILEKISQDSTLGS